MPFTRNNLAALYLMWRNDYLSITTFADHFGLTIEEAQGLLAVAKSCHQNPHPDA
jgi:hypothetical protein